MKEMFFKYEYYETNVGFFFRRHAASYDNNLNHVNSINGIPAKEIVSINGWWKLNAPITQVLFDIPGTRTRVGWKITDPITFDKLPPYFEDSVVQSYWSDNDELEWKNHSELQALYVEVYETTEATVVSATLVGAELGNFTVSDYQDPSKMKVMATMRGAYTEKTAELNLSKIAQYSDIEKMLTPEFMIHMRPCELTSKQVYEIVRRHILDNIDRNHAVISSNYDFCFEVQKIVQTKPFSDTVSVKKGRSWASKTVKSSEKKITVWRMSYDNYDKGKPYGDYPAIEAIKANNLQELADKLKEMLDNILALINTPVKECECCNGTGWLVKT